VVAAGCGNEPSQVPVACFDGHVSRALAGAPGAVLLEGRTKLSQCFTRNAEPAQIQEVASIFIAAASKLAPAARAHPHSASATQLGYLIGAVRHGAGRTQGIHYETERRIEQELIGVNTRTPEFVEGERAGERTG
jgi:hypothetical protein